MQHSFILQPLAHLNLRTAQSGAFFPLANSLTAVAPFVSLFVTIFLLTSLWHFNVVAFHHVRLTLLSIYLHLSLT